MIRRVILEATDRPPRASTVELLASEFAGATVTTIGSPEQARTAILITTAEWQADDVDPLEVDERFACAETPEARALVLRGQRAELLRTGWQVLGRYQRLLPRTNEASGHAAFAYALERHREIHDVSRPLIRAGLDHALDTWQWVLRLEHGASMAVQLAALFHDAERLLTEKQRRVEHLTPDYQAFRDAHARAGARLTQLVLGLLPFPRGVVDRAVTMVARHERPGDDPDLALLADADALSFFSLDSWGFLRDFGPAHTARKVAYTLERMRPRARARLAGMRLPPLIEGMIASPRWTAEPRVAEPLRLSS